MIIMKEKELKQEIENILREHKYEFTPTMIYTIYYIVLLKEKVIKDKHIIQQLYLYVRRRIKEGMSSDYILEKIKKAYEYNKYEGKKIDKVILYVNKVLQNNK